MTTRDDLVKLIAVCEKAMLSPEMVLLDPAAVLPILNSISAALEAKDAEIARLRELIDDAADLIKMQQEWQPYGEQLERDADAAMAAEIQDQRKKNAALRDCISDLERQLAEIDRIVHTPTPSGEKATRHFQRDFDAIRKLTAPFHPGQTT